MQAKLTRSKVYFAGICSLVITMGVARFSYTPLIPIMQSGTGLSELAAGWLATANYLGYMLGVFMAASMNSLKQKYLLHQVCLLLGIVTAGTMALTTDLVIWSILRFFAGLCGVGGGIIASGLVLKWLVHNKHRGELGIHFAGAGFSIILVSLLVEALLHFSATWQQQWVALSVLAVVFAVPAWRWMPHPTADVDNSASVVEDRPPGNQFTLFMLLAYFCAGYGFVVSATFIVDIVEGLESLQGWGQYIFVLVGLSVIPAALLWDLAARRWGYLKALLFAYGIQAIGILLPALSHAPWAIVVSAISFGGTFIACVSLVLTLAGRFYPSNPSKFMGKMTLAYGVAQIIAPLITGYLAQVTGSYDSGLYLSTAVMVAGVFLVLKLIRLQAVGGSSLTTA